MGYANTIKHRWTHILTGVALMLFSANSVLVSSAMAAEDIRPAPHCDLTHWSSGDPFDLHNLRGKVVYVDFWASWCASCVDAFPFLNKLEHDLADRGLVVVGINLDEQRADAARFLTKYPVNFTVATNTTKQCPKAFGVSGMPAAYLIDRNGNIRHEHLGFRSGHAHLLSTVVEQLLNE